MGFTREITPAINHGARTPERKRAAAHLLAQLTGRPEFSRPILGPAAPTALEGARQTLIAALAHVATDPDTPEDSAWIWYIEDDARLSGGWRVDLHSVAALAEAADHDLVWLYSGQALAGMPPLDPPRLIPRHRPVLGAVSVLLRPSAAARALVRHRAELSPVPVERLFLDGASADALAWPSIVDHRGELPSAHRPGSGGEGSRSPSLAAAAYIARAKDLDPGEARRRMFAELAADETRRLPWGRR